MAKVGRKEIIPKEMALQISRMILRMPDKGIPVNWENVIAHARKIHHKKFNRSMLSQKKWDGSKLIADAFNEAKNVQKRKKNDSAPKYKTASRAVLQIRLMERDAKILALQDELEMERALKVDTLDTFLNTRCDLLKLLGRVEK